MNKSCLKIGGDDLESITALAEQAYTRVICGVLGGRGNETYGVYNICGKCSSRFYGCSLDCGSRRLASDTAGAPQACPNCGKVQPEGVRFCASCGLPQNPFKS